MDVCHVHQHVLNFISKVYYFDSVHLRHKIFHNFFLYKLVPDMIFISTNHYRLYREKD